MTKLIKWLSEAKKLSSIAVVYSLLVTVVFLLPANDVPQVNVPFLDKFIHLLIHWMLCFIWLWYFFIADNYHSFTKNVFVVLTLCFSYGILIEALQHWFTQSRRFDLFDIIANGIGCLIGLLSFLIVRKKLSTEV